MRYTDPSISLAFRKTRDGETVFHSGWPGGHRYIVSPSTEQALHRLMEQRNVVLVLSIITQPIAYAVSVPVGLVYGLGTLIVGAMWYVRRMKRILTGSAVVDAAAAPPKHR